MSEFIITDEQLKTAAEAYVKLHEIELPITKVVISGDELTRIVRCVDCGFFDTRKCKSQWPFRLDGFCAWGERREK